MNKIKTQNFSKIFVEIVHNPFFIYVFALFGALLFYKLEWIEYPELGRELNLFLCFSIVLSLVLGIFVKRIPYAEKKIQGIDLFKVLLILVAISFVGFAATYINAGKVPLFYILWGKENYIYNQDLNTIKYFTTIIKALSGLVLVSSFSLFFHLKDKRFLLLAFGAFLLVLSYGSRAYAMLVMIPSFLLFFKNVKLNIKWFLIVVIAAICLIFLFGYYGNNRNSAKERNDYSLYDEMDIKNYPQWLHEDFTWFYLYYTSPLAKFQYVIQDVDSKEFTSDCKTLFFREFVDNTVARRIYKDFESKVRVSSLGFPEYFVGTAFDDVYLYGKWVGVVTYLFYLFGVVYLLIYFAKRQVGFISDSIIAVLSTALILSIFENMFSYTEIVFLLSEMILFALVLFYFDKKVIDKK